MGNIDPNLGLVISILGTSWFWINPLLTSYHSVQTTYFRCWLIPKNMEGSYAHKEKIKKEQKQKTNWEKREIETNWEMRW